MEGRRNSSLCTVSRRYEPHRLEEQVLALAYEQVWPVFRQALKAPRHAARVETDQRAIGTFATVRSA